jgi:hypothetical protein
MREYCLISVYKQIMNRGAQYLPIGIQIVLKYKPTTLEFE